MTETMNFEGRVENHSFKEHIKLPRSCNKSGKMIKHNGDIFMWSSNNEWVNITHTFLPVKVTADRKYHKPHLIWELDSKTV